MAINRLKARFCEQVKFNPTLKDGTPKRRNADLHADGGNLFLQVKRSGSKSWLFKYTLNGVDREMGLGGYPTFSLAAARERALEPRRQLADRIDPLEARKAKNAEAAAKEVKTITFEEAAWTYYRQHVANVKKNAKDALQFISSLRTYAFPVLGKLSVSDIDIPLVMRVLEPIWNDKTETASRVRRRIEWVLGWATGRGYRSGDNPAAWTALKGKGLKPRGKVQKTVPHPALAWEAAPGFYAELEKREAVAAKALGFLMLTALRASEVRLARWDEFDLDKAVWTVPADRMKMGEEHRVPLSPTALELLWALPREKGNPYGLLPVSWTPR